MNISENLHISQTQWMEPFCRLLNPFSFGLYSGCCSTTQPLSGRHLTLLPWMNRRKKKIRISSNSNLAWCVDFNTKSFERMNSLLIRIDVEKMMLNDDGTISYVRTNFLLLLLYLNILFKFLLKLPPEKFTFLCFIIFKNWKLSH